MPIDLAAFEPWIKPAVTVLLLGGLWCWESLDPFFQPRNRLRHAGHNLAIAVFNTVVLALLFSSATVAVAATAAQNRWGLLHQFEAPGLVRGVLAIVLADAWLYVWHRANHRVALLWRFHRMHHSDNAMDVTTATRFHLGEHIGSSTLRLALIPLVGFEAVHLLIYDTLVVAITMFHHANISIGRWDVPLRAVIVTPFMHKVHHSRWQPETDSNYSTLFSWWDRLWGSFRMREDCSTIEFGLEQFDESRWQRFGGMLKTPFVTPQPPTGSRERPNPETASATASAARASDPERFT